MATTEAPKRRELRFASHDEIIDEARSLIENGHETRGNWSLGQILEHLARGNDAAFEGFDFSVPWLVRTFIGPLMRKRFIHSSMPPGYQFQTKTVLDPPANVDAIRAFTHFERTLERLKHEAPAQPHPLIGYLTHHEWNEYITRHAELHLSFAHPV